MTKQNKNKNLKKKYEDEIDDEEEEENDGEDNYVMDGFLVPEYDMEEENEEFGNARNPYLHGRMDEDLPDAVIESELGSSDLELDDKEPKSKKILKKKNINNEEVDIESDNYRKKAQSRKMFNEAKDGKFKILN